MDGVFFKWWYVTLSSPDDELDDLFILPGIIGDRSKVSFHLGQVMA